jgi:hypothetical protein
VAAIATIGTYIARAVRKVKEKESAEHSKAAGGG